MGRTISRLANPLIVDLRCGDVSVSKKFLDVEDIHSSLQEQGSGGRSEGMGRVVFRLS